MKNYKAVILDMDGTLVNTEKLWKVAERDLLRAYDRVYDPIIHAEFLGLSVGDFIAALRRAYDLTHIPADVLEHELENRVHRILIEDTQPTTGASDLIDYLIENKIPCAIASNSSSAIIRATLRNQRWADAIGMRFSADEVPNAKPAPDLYLHSARQLGVNPGDCIAVEDSLNGAKSAVSAGMTCLAVPDSELADVTKYQAVTPYVFESLHQVLNFIQNEA